MVLSQLLLPRGANGGGAAEYPAASGCVYVFFSVGDTDIRMIRQLVVKFYDDEGVGMFAASKPH